MFLLKLAKFGGNKRSLVVSHAIRSILEICEGNWIWNELTFVILFGARFHLFIKQGVPVLLKMDLHQIQVHRETCTFLGPASNWLNLNLWEWGPGICIFSTVDHFSGNSSPSLQWRCFFSSRTLVIDPFYSLSFIGCFFLNHLGGPPPSNFNCHFNYWSNYSPERKYFQCSLHDQQRLQVTLLYSEVQSHLIRF